MTPWQISWRDAIKPIAHWLFRLAPAFIFRRFYTARDLEGDIQILLSSSEPLTIHLPRGMQVPRLEIGLTITNMSPYLDARIVGLHSFLDAGEDEHPAQPFARYDDYKRLDLPRRVPKYARCEFWLNEYQMEVVRRFVERRVWVRAFVFVHLRSRIGQVTAREVLELKNPEVL